MNKVLGTVVVRAESVPGEGGFKDLQRVERDADIDAVVLAIYWNRPQNDNDEHPWMSELRDLMFSAEPVGSGVEAIVDRFLRHEEEKQRDAMGMSALRRAQELERLVQQGEAQRDGMNDSDLAAHLLATKASLKTKWSKDTCQRYLLIVKRFDRRALAIMDKWEMKYGRSALLDGFGTDAQCHHSSSDM